MTKLHARAKLIENYRIDADDQRTHATCLDQPVSEGGTDMGPSPLELCLMSFAGCYATIFALAVKKMRFSIKNLEVNVEGVKSDAVGTISEANVDVFVEADMPEDRLERAHELTVRSCPVGKLFEKAGVKMKYNLRSTKP